MAQFPGFFMAEPAYVPKDDEISAFELLTRKFAAHEKLEMEFLEGYQEISDNHANPLVRFLLQMIMSDEEKHHEVIHAMTSSLREGLMGQKIDGALPKMGGMSGEEKETLQRLTSEYLKAEKACIKDLEPLIKSSEGFYKGVFVLLLKTIVHDSEKHVMILEFIDKKLRES